jgi:predicted GTPase
MQQQTEKQPKKKLFSSLLKFGKGKGKEKQKNSPNVESASFPPKPLGSKTILLIGSTGKGKSTLANVLVDEKGEFKEIFGESGASISVTREIQQEKFTENGVNYAIIDTVGLGDTKLEKDKVLDKIAEAVYLAREGISQVFFVIDGRFDQKEMANYDLLKAVIFDQEVVNHTTIIRTRFENFQSKEYF